MSQSQVPLVLASECWASMIESMIARLDISPQILYLEKLDFQNYEDKNLPIRCYPENLAYVIYTSGSTGEPKGAMLEHCGMLNHLYAMVTNLQLSATDVVAQTATQTFDISVWQFLVALLIGGRVEIVPTEIAADPDQLRSLLQRQQISILEIVPSLLRMILQQIELEQMELDPGTQAQVYNLRWLLITGETCPPQLCHQWLKYYPSIPMMNAYGPAECSDDVTLYPIYEPPAPEVLNLPIGRQISNTQLYILDTQLQLVPIGVVGELYVGGVGVGRGYLHNQKLTSVAFIASPFAQTPGERLYKTGDRARYLPDGNIEFLNRVDYQVKVRGFRIELGEIEAKLHQHPSISQSVVIVREDVPGDKRLVAYLVPKQQPPLTQPTQDQSDLRHFLKQQLPDYMIPSAFVMLDALPLNANGKVDRKALPVANLNCRELETFVAPRNPIEEVVAGIWAEVLGLEKVGIHENFFALGGHSLLATQVMSRMRDSFHMEIPLQTLFQASTVAELSQMALSYETKLGQTEKIARVLKKINTMSNDDLKQTQTISPRANSHEFPLSFAQARLWFLDHLEPGNSLYNGYSSVRLEGKLNVSVLEESFNTIISRHEALRTNFVTKNGHPVQVIAETLHLTVPVVDLQNLPATEREIATQQLATQEAHRPFNLTTEPLVRIKLLKRTEIEHVLLVCMHHIIGDGWSTGILVQELAIIYSALCNSLPPQLPELPIQYADFAIWQREWLQGEVLESQLAYWKQQLHGVPALLKLSTDRPRPAIQTFQGARQCFTLSKELTEALTLLSRREGVTLFMTLLAVYQILLYRYSGQDDICVGTPIANRNLTEIEGLIGFFVNTLVLRTDLSGNPSFRELMQRVREVALGAYAHQDIPFEKLVAELQPERNLSKMPLFQVWFVLDNSPMPPLELPGLTISLLDYESQVVRYDLKLDLSETPEGIKGFFEYKTDLFETYTITRMTEVFEIILTIIVEDADIKLSRVLEILDVADTQTQMLKNENFKQGHYQKLRNIERKKIRG